MTERIWPGWRRSVVWLLLVAAAVAGCAGSPEAEPSVSSSPPVSSFAEQLYWAEVNGDAGEVQVEALRAAMESGQMSYAELESLILDSFACFDASGVDYRRIGDLEIAPGLLMPGYMLGEPIEVGDACVAEHSGYAELAYQAQPSAVEARDARIEANRDVIVACLREQGVVIDDDATVDEMRTATIDHIVYVDQVLNRPDDAVDCMADYWH